jgi:hypothetical protein
MGGGVGKGVGGGAAIVCPSSVVVDAGLIAAEHDQQADPGRGDQQPQGFLQPCLVGAEGCQQLVPFGWGEGKPRQVLDLVVVERGVDQDGRFVVAVG